VLVYNAARFGLFVGCAVLGYVAGLRGVVLLAGALLVSGVLSWFLLARQRTAMAQVVDDAVARGRRRLAARTEAEDAYVDEVLAAQGSLRPDVTGPDTSRRRET
jgi:hypothetical protein